MTWFTTHRKAAYAALGGFVGPGSALLALGFLSGRLSHVLAIALVAATPLLAGVATAVAPANASPPQVSTQIVQPSRAEALADEIRQVLADAELIRAAVFANPVRNRPLNESAQTIGGIVAPTPSPT